MNNKNLKKEWMQEKKTYKLTEFNLFLFLKMDELGISFPIPTTILRLLKKQFYLQRKNKMNNDI